MRTLVYLKTEERRLERARARAVVNMDSSLAHRLAGLLDALRARLRRGRYLGGPRG